MNTLKLAALFLIIACNQNVLANNADDVPAAAEKMKKGRFQLNREAYEVRTSSLYC